MLANEEKLLAQRGNLSDAQRIRAARTAIDVLVKWLGETQDRARLLASVAAYAMEQGETDAKWIRLFTAALRAQKALTASNVAVSVYDALPTTTLAVLLDEAPTIRMEGDRVRLDGTMRYRYATTLMRVANGLLVMSEGAGTARNRVETIAELTDLANGAMPSLVERYAPLQRVS